MGRKQIALNRLFNFSVVAGLFLMCCSIAFFTENDIAWGLGLGVTALLIIVIPAIFTPYCYIFDNEGVSLCYVFLPCERYLWNDVYAIEVQDTSTTTDVFDLLFAYVFKIKGKNVGKKRFYMNGYIRKSFRTKRMLEKYWDGTITGYLFKDIGESVNKCKTKKAPVQAYLTDEIARIEREIRSEARGWLMSLTEKAKQQDLEIKTKYVYITKDLDELNSRPQEGYTYTLVAEIARFNETDESRAVSVSTDLLYVRLGRTAYRGVKNEYAKDELEFTISDVLKAGVEVYCKNT